MKNPKTTRAPLRSRVAVLFFVIAVMIILGLGVTLICRLSPWQFIHPEDAIRVVAIQEQIAGTNESVDITQVVLTSDQTTIRSYAIPTESKVYAVTCRWVAITLPPQCEVTAVQPKEIKQ